VFKVRKTKQNNPVNALRKDDQRILGGKKLRATPPVHFAVVILEMGGITNYLPWLTGL
jgi:hypothetical protein